MPRRRSIDIVTEWADISLALEHVEKATLRGWQNGWTLEKQAEAIAWLLYGRKEAKRQKRRLRRIHRARVQREQRSKRAEYSP